jgi:hypothetical protein
MDCQPLTVFCTLGIVLLLQKHMKQMTSGCFTVVGKAAGFQLVCNIVRRNKLFFSLTPEHGSVQLNFLTVSTVVYFCQSSENQKE